MHQLSATRKKNDASHHRFSARRLWKSPEPAHQSNRLGDGGQAPTGNESAKKGKEASTYERDPNVTLTAHDSWRPKTLLEFPSTQPCLDEGDGQQRGQRVRSNGDTRPVQLVQWSSPLMGHAWVRIPWVLKRLDASHHRLEVVQLGGLNGVT